MKRASDGCAAESGGALRQLPSLQAVETHRCVLHDEQVIEVLALGNDGSTVQRSHSYWCITANGSATQNGVALTIPHGCRGPVSLMNDRACAVCTQGLVLLTTSTQTILPLSTVPEACFQLFESEVIILLFCTHATALHPDGTEAILPTTSHPVSVAHDTGYQYVDVVTRDGSRYRYDSTIGWHQVHLPVPDVPATLQFFDTKSGGSAWLTEGGELRLYHMAPEPLVVLPVGRSAMFTGCSRYLYVLLDHVTYPTVVPEVGVIDMQTFKHWGTLFPDKMLAMGRTGDSYVCGAHYPYVLWRSSLFKLA
jgi:hypothetical protein